MVNETPHSVDEQNVAAPGAEEDGQPAVPGAAPGKILTPEAVRALQEAEARRLAASQDPGRQELPTEIGGRNGEEPTRFGDWEKKGLAVDF
jgi:hypothetical protein